MKVSVLPAVVALAVLSAYAEAEPRKGFYLSGGFGIHSSEFSATYEGDTLSEDNGGIHTSFKIGGHIQPQFALYFVREASWWNDQEMDETLVSGLTGIGGTYYFEPQVGSGYIEFGLGIGDVTAVNDPDIEPLIGTAYTLGLGLEATEHLQFALVYSKSDTSIEDLPGVDFANSAIAGKVELKL